MKEVGLCEVAHVAGSIMTTVGNVLMITNGKREMKFSLSALRSTSVLSLRARERERERAPLASQSLRLATVNNLIL